MNRNLTLSRVGLIFLVAVLLCVAISMLVRGMILCFDQYREYLQVFLDFLEQLRPFIRSAIVLALWGGCAAATYLTRVKHPVLSEWLLSVTVLLYAFALPVLIYTFRGSVGSIDSYLFLWAIGAWAAAFAARTWFLPVASALLLLIFGHNLFDASTVWDTFTCGELAAAIVAALIGWFVWLKRGIPAAGYLMRFALFYWALMAIDHFSDGACVWTQLIFAAAVVLILWLVSPQKPMSLECAVLGLFLLAVSCERFLPDSELVPSTCPFLAPMENYFREHLSLSNLVGTILLFLFLVRLYAWRGSQRIERICYGYSILLFTGWVFGVHGVLAKFRERGSLAYPLMMLGVSALIFLAVAFVWRRSFSDRPAARQSSPSPFVEEPLLRWLFTSAVPLAWSHLRLCYLAAFVLQGAALLGAIFY